MGRVVIPGFRKIETRGGGEGGTTNYNDLTNKPSINNVPLVGNLNTVDLNLTDATLKEEGVPAESKTVGAKLEEQSTSLIALSGQLGNHTVKSDVPENAVFTDTVYDDTDVKEEIYDINSNLVWKFHKKTVGTTPVDYPTNAREIMVIAKANDNVEDNEEKELSYTAIIPYMVIGSGVTLNINRYKNISIYFSGSGKCQGNSYNYDYYLYYK